MKDLWRWGAVELARAIRAREISSREAVQSCLARIAAVNPRINAIVDLMAGKSRGRQSPDDITYFINSGTQGLQFAAVAGRVYQLAKERGLGREIPTDWFLQDIRD